MRRIGPVLISLIAVVLAVAASASCFQAALAGPSDAITTLADGSTEARLVFDAPGSRTLHLRIPADWSAPRVRLDIQGDAYDTGEVDQKNEASRYSGAYSVLAQQFTPTAGSLSAVELYLAHALQKTDDGFTVEIRQDDGKGYPSSTVLISSTKSLPVAKYRWVRFDFPSIEVQPGRPYWIVGYVVNPDKLTYPSEPSLGDYGYYIGLSTDGEYPGGDLAGAVVSTAGLHWAKYPSWKSWALLFRTISAQHRFPNNPSVRLAGSAEDAWSLAGEFSGLVTVDLTAQVTRYLALNSAPPGSSDWDIPIEVSSGSPGTIRVSNVRIEKQTETTEAAAPISASPAGSTSGEAERASPPASAAPTLDTILTQPYTITAEPPTPPTATVGAIGTPAPAPPDAQDQTLSSGAQPATTPAPPKPLGPMGPRFVPPSNITFKSLGFGDTTVFGVVVSRDFYVPGAGGFPLAGGNYLKLFYSHSGILLADRSTMIVSLNGTPLATVRLGPDNTNLTELKLALPKSELLDTFNHIRIDFYMRIMDGVCTDELNNPGLNATIYGESAIHYQYASLSRTPPAPPPTLADYPVPFVYPSYPWPDEMVFVIPDAPSPTELTAASSVAAKLGQIASSKTITPTVATTTQLDKERREGYNLIFVGKAQSLNLPMELAQAASLQVVQDVTAGTPSLKLDGEKLATDSGVIVLVNSPWNHANWVLLVTGTTDQAVQRAGTVLSTGTYLRTLKGDHAVVTQDPEPGALLGEDDPSLPKEATFAQMGVSDILFSGMGQLTASSVGFSSPAPNPNDTAYMDLVISHSPLVVAAESSLRVDLNGLPVRSIALDDKTLQPTVVRVELPYSVLKPGPNTLTFRPTMYGQVTESCGAVDASRTWVIVHSESLVHLPAAGPEPPLSLRLFPYPFLGTGPRLESAYLQRNALVLPDDPAQWQDYLLLAAALGRYSTADPVSLPTMRNGNAPDATRYQRNVILYGTWNAIGMLKGASASLPLQFAAGQVKTFQVPEEQTVSVSEVAPTGAVQTIPSPWSKGKALLVVSGNQADTLRWDVSALSKGGLRGNLFTVNGKDDVDAFYQTVRWPWQ